MEDTYELKNPEAGSLCRVTIRVKSKVCPVKFGFRGFVGRSAIKLFVLFLHTFKLINVGSIKLIIIMILFIDSRRKTEFAIRLK